MQRSVGVTLSAVLVFCGCAMALLFAVLLAFVSQISPFQVPSTPIVRGVLILEIVIALAFAGWGIASGIGLLQLRQWARTSMIVFSGIMICFCAIPMAIFLFVPVPRPEGMPVNFVVMVRVFVELFYGFFVALGVFWIYFFNRKTVKTQFSQAVAPEGAIVAGPAIGAAEPTSNKPVLIMLLGVFFLLGSCFLPFALKMRTPLFFFGSFVHGTTDAVFISVLLVLNVAAGIGLLRMNLWGWRLALFLSAFNVLNTGFLVFTPGALLRLNSAMAEQFAATGMPGVAAEYPFTAIMRVSLGFGLLVAVAFLWILIAYRKAFQPTGSDPAI